MSERPPEPPRPEQEGFGEASLGDAQSSEPPADPEMIEEDPAAEAQPANGGGEAGGDQDAEPPASPEDVEGD